MASGSIQRCRRDGSLRCESAGILRDAVTALAGDPVTDGVVIGCADGRILLGLARCSGQGATTAPPSSSVTALAASRDHITKVQGKRRVCIADRRRLDSCDPLAIAGLSGIDSVAASLDDSLVAVTGRKDVAASHISIYRKEWTVPWPGRAASAYTHLADIDCAGRIIAIAFTDDATWLYVLAAWKDQLVTQRFPTAASAAREATR
jgi:hypothetical protein